MSDVDRLRAAADEDDGGDDSGRTRLDLAAAQAAERRSKGRLSALDLLTPSDDDRYVPPPTAKRRLRGAGPLPGKRSSMRWYCDCAVCAAASDLADTILGVSDE